ncbi:MAG: 1,4-dihydroxy-2-naphthoate polyprenyltransferase [Candidatus Hydrogenedentes bacterium]|nr:1,4-dihydroxy-2-naphthoate polyprenyltransferase [Candidatus Hydrogenedentota bacterium]
MAKVWLLAARPKTLPAAVAPVVIGSAIANHDVLSVHWPSLFCALAGAVFIQIGTNFANDYFDFVKGTDTADRIGPTRATQAGLIKPETMRIAFICAFALALLPGAYIIYRGGWPYLAIGIISIICGVLYTGGPFPLGYLGLGDVFVLIFFGPVAVCGTYYLHVLDVTRDVFIASLAPGLISCALLTVNNLRDVDQDRVGNKRTLAVRFGRAFARAEYVLCVATACAAIPIYFAVAYRNYWFFVVPIICALVTRSPFTAVLRSVEGPVLNNALGSTGKLLLAFSVAFSVCFLL